MDIEKIARACHEVNRAYCMAMEDDSQPPWDQAPDWQKQSAIEGVKTIVENPDNTPELQHIGWMRSKVTDGWRYGPVKDVDAKTHPCLVPYDELPAWQRSKDSIFLAVVKGLLFF